MNFTFAHNNLNVFDLNKSLDFYQKALGLRIKRRYEPEDKSFQLVYLTDEQDSYELELTWLADRTEPYDLGDNEIHLAFTAPEFEAAWNLHQEMGCICFENKSMGIYFIEDPDGYWLEIVPAKA